MKMLRCVSVPAAGLALATACANRVAVGPPIPAEGRASFRALNPLQTANGQGEAQVESVTPAYASSENKVPEYPAYALKATCGAGTVPVRVYISPEGNVTSQRDIPDRPLPNDGCHIAFRAAVQSAVGEWKFAPAYHMKPVRGPMHDGEPGLTRWEQTPIAVYLDFEFFFEVVAGKGVVRSR